MLFGYARVSSADQNPAHQIDALERAGIDAANIHTDYAGGAKASRPQLDAMLTRMRGGDTLVITRLDRLGRSVVHLITLGAELRERGIGLKVLEQGIDTATAEGWAMFGMLSVLAELQRELIVANTRDGLAAARARGRQGGRPSKLSGDQIELAQQLYDAGGEDGRADRGDAECSSHHRLRASQQTKLCDEFADTDSSWQRMYDGRRSCFGGANIPDLSVMRVRAEHQSGSRSSACGFGCDLAASSS